MRRLCQSISCINHRYQHRLKFSSCQNKEDGFKGGGVSGGGSSAEDDVKERMLNLALLHVPLLGWSEDALAKAATDVGLPPLSHRIVERGPAEIVELFIKNKRAHVRNVMNTVHDMTEANSGGNEGNTNTTNTAAMESEDDALYLAIEAHLDYIAPYASSWPSALALMAEPQQLPHTLNAMMATVDDLCDFAAIHNSRGGWYVERGLLLSLFCSTELYLLSDASNNFTDTKAFLKNGISQYRSVKNPSNNSLLSLINTLIIGKQA